VRRGASAPLFSFGVHAASARFGAKERILAAFRDRSTNAPSLDPMQPKEFLNQWMKKTA
jgi:hypothetical protein